MAALKWVAISGVFSRMKNVREDLLSITNVYKLQREGEELTSGVCGCRLASILPCSLSLGSLSLLSLFLSKLSHFLWSF